MRQVAALGPKRFCVDARFFAMPFQHSGLYLNRAQEEQEARGVPVIRDFRFFGDIRRSFSLCVQVSLSLSGLSVILGNPRVMEIRANTLFWA